MMVAVVTARECIRANVCIDFRRGDGSQNENRRRSSAAYRGEDAMSEAVFNKDKAEQTTCEYSH